MSIFGHIQGKIYGDWTLVGDKNKALVAISFAQQARKTLDELGIEDRHIIIFGGSNGDGEYMGWRTGRDNSLNIIEEAIV